jgi:protein-disulfide isomerase
MKRIIPIVIIVVVLAAGVLAFRYLQKPAPATPSVPTGSQSAAVTGPVGSNSNPSSAPVNAAATAAADPGSDPPHALGNANAPVTLEEFGDFECPPCGMLHPILRDIEKEYGPAKVRIIFREFPLVPNHAHALAAARAAEAAGMQGKFWEMHDMIYETQKDWHESFDTRPIFEGYATKIGLNLEKFREDQTSNTVEQRIFQDGKRGHSLKVLGTPTVFMNGREVPFESLAPDKLKALINAELAARQ